MNSKPISKKEIFDILRCIKIKKLNSETINIIDSEERFLAKDIQSSINLPPFKNSAVDGYAIHDNDIENLNELTIKHRIVAGDDKQIELLNGEVAKKCCRTVMVKWCGCCSARPPWTSQLGSLQWVEH